MSTAQNKTDIQYTLRRIPPDVDAYLRREAKRLRKSLNQVAIEYLTVGAKEWRKLDSSIDTPGQAAASHWLDEFAKRGTIDADTQAVIEAQAILDKKRMKREK